MGERELREAQQLNSQLDEDKEGLTGAQAAYNEAQSRLEQTQIGFREDARNGLGETRREIEELRERLKKFEDSLLMQRMLLLLSARGEC